MERQGNQMGSFPKSKINLGIDVMGARMSGVTAPWQTIPSGTSINADYKFFTFYTDVLRGRESTVNYDPVARITSYNVCYTKLLRGRDRPGPPCSSVPSGS